MLVSYVIISQHSRFERLVELVTMIGDKGELPIAMALASVVATHHMDELARVFVTLFDAKHLLYQLLWNMFSKEVCYSMWIQRNFMSIRSEKIVCGLYFHDIHTFVSHISTSGWNSWLYADSISRQQLSVKNYGVLLQDLWTSVLERTAKSFDNGHVWSRQAECMLWSGSGEVTHNLNSLNFVHDSLMYQ